MTATSFVIPVPPQPSLPVVGEAKSYPVRRIWCVGRNYLEHIREMGNDERAPPFFFAKHADMLVPDGATVPYPPLTKDLHHEVELVVAMKSGGLNIPADKALDHVYGYAVGIDLTRRDLQIASRKKERPWEVGKSFDYSAPCSAIQPAAKIGHPSKGKIWLTVNGKETQKGDLTELIWSVPEIIWQLSQQVKLAAGDIIMTGTPAGVSQLHPGDTLRCIRGTRWERRLRLRQRLQTLEGQALGVLDAGEIEPANEGSDHFPVAIGQRNDGINGNSLGVHVISSGFLTRSKTPTARL